MSRPWVRFPPLAPESRNNLDAEGVKPSAPSCFGFFYAQKSHTGAMDVSGVCQATGGIRTPVFGGFHRFSHTAPFFRVKKGTQTAKYSAQSYSAGFMDDAQVQKPAPFFVL